MAITRKRLHRRRQAIVRRAFYMPAVVATRFNPDLKAKYDQLIKAGKPPKVAITAIMRKLLVLANTLLRQNPLDQNRHFRCGGLQTRHGGASVQSILFRSVRMPCRETDPKSDQ